VRITFLGTGTSQGVPVIGCDCTVCRSEDPRDNRLRTSVHIYHQQKSFVIDTGPDFRQQMLREKILELDFILFTHHHKDHVAGMDDIRSYNFRSNRAMPIYASQDTLLQLKAEFPYVFTPHGYGGAPKIEVNEIRNHPFHANGLKITPLEVLHHKLPVFGFRIGDFAYITDASQIPEKEVEKIRNVKILVINALQKSPHVSHFTLHEALDEIKRINPGEAYLTHISHRMGRHAKVSPELPPNVSLAYDGLKIEI
jgi:phosphoribosyl 1,2-cyclic phosphate phosphodiesterase